MIIGHLELLRISSIHHLTLWQRFPRWWHVLLFQALSQRLSAQFTISQTSFLSETQSARSEMLQPISPFRSLCSALRWHCFLGSAEHQALTFVWALDEKRKRLIISATPSLCCSHSDFFYCLSPNCF